MRVVIERLSKTYRDRSGQSVEALQSIDLGVEEEEFLAIVGPSVALMRGHGAVVVGASLPQMVFRSVYTEVNARLQAQAMALGGSVTYLDPEEARKAEATVAGTVGRPWELWKRKALAK